MAITMPQLSMAANGSHALLQVRIDGVRLPGVMSYDMAVLFVLLSFSAVGKSNDCD